MFGIDGSWFDGPDAEESGCASSASDSLVNSVAVAEGRGTIVEAVAMEVLIDVDEDADMIGGVSRLLCPEPSTSPSIGADGAEEEPAKSCWIYSPVAYLDVEIRQPLASHLTS
jgi:hypothetical protein